MAHALVWSPEAIEGIEAIATMGGPSRPRLSRQRKPFPTIPSWVALYLKLVTQRYASGLSTVNPGRAGEKKGLAYCIKMLRESAGETCVSSASVLADGVGGPMRPILAKEDHHAISQA